MTDLTVLYIALGTIAVLCALFLWLLFPSPRRHAGRELLRERYVAHRGLHDCPGVCDAPENSLTAFRAAAKRGYVIETDIHVTADGRVVVFHDDSLLRMCGVDKAPESLTLAELRQLRLAGGEECIPTLEELLEAVDGRVPLLIEFKCTTLPVCRRLCEAAAPLLDRYTGAYLVQSFFPFVLSWYRHHRRRVCRGQLSAGFRDGKLHMRLLGDLLFNFISRPDFVSYDHRDERHLCRRLCTRLGAFPVCWTIRSREELEAARPYFKSFIFEGFLPEPKGDVRK